MKLYKCLLKSEIRGLVDKTEYLRCKSEEILTTMFKECFAWKGSTYFGYSAVVITEMKMSDFPEVMTVKVNCK